MYDETNHEEVFFIYIQKFSLLVLYENDKWKG